MPDVSALQDTHWYRGHSFSLPSHQLYYNFSTLKPPALKFGQSHTSSRDSRRAVAVGCRGVRYRTLVQRTSEYQERDQLCLWELTQRDAKMHSPVWRVSMRGGFPPQQATFAVWLLREELWHPHHLGMLHPQTTGPSLSKHSSSSCCRPGWESLASIFTLASSP